MPVVEKTREQWHCGKLNCKDCQSSSLNDDLNQGKVKIQGDNLLLPTPPKPVGPLKTWPGLTPLPPLVYVKWPDLKPLGPFVQWPIIPPPPPLGPFVKYPEPTTPLWKTHKNGMEGPGNRGTMGNRFSVVPDEWGWPTEYATREYGDDYEGFWGHHFNQFDPIEAAADFYLLGAVHDRLWVAQADSRWSGNRWLDVIIEEGKQKYKKHVDLWAPMLASYMDMVIGGELRHHQAVGAKHLAGRDSRPHAWVTWKFLRKEVGPDALIHAAELFRDIGRGGFGGDKWAIGCEVLHAYVVRKIPAPVFIDRVWDLEHNGGCFLNKITWNLTRNERPIVRHKFTISATRVVYRDGNEYHNAPYVNRFTDKAAADKHVRAMKAVSKKCDQKLADGMPAEEYRDIKVTRERQTVNRAYGIQTIKAEIGPAHASDDWGALLYWGTKDATKIFRDYREAVAKDRIDMMGARGALPAFERYNWDRMNKLTSGRHH